MLILQGGQAQPLQTPSPDLLEMRKLAFQKFVKLTLNSESFTSEEKATVTISRNLVQMYESASIIMKTKTREINLLEKIPDGYEHTFEFTVPKVT